MVKTFLGELVKGGGSGKANIYTLKELTSYINPVEIFTTEKELSKNFINLFSALRETSSPKDRKEIIGKLVENLEEVHSKEDKLFSNSIGRGHTAAQDLVSILARMTMPRFMTLLLTDNPYSFIGLLQRSTRRVEHDSYFLPESIERNEGLSKKVKEYYNKVQELFDNILGQYDKDSRKSMRELVMYIQPLSLLTSAYYLFDWRNISMMLHTLGVDKADENQKQDFLSEYGNLIKNELKSLDDFLVKDFGQNFNPKLMYPSNGLMYGSNVNDFIDFLGDSDVKISSVNIAPHLKGKFSDMKKLINALTHPEDKERFENVKNTLLGLSIGVYFKTDLSLLHELFRHRTVNYLVPSLKSTVEYAIKNGAIENDKVLRSLFTIPPQLNEFSDKILNIYRESLHLYKELVDNGIPANDALLVIPHGIKTPVYMEMNGWNLYKLFGERLCSTAKISIRSLMSAVRTKLAEYTQGHNLPHIELLAQPKCFFMNECPEHRENSCPQKALIGGYKKFMNNG